SADFVGRPPHQDRVESAYIFRNPQLTPEVRGKILWKLRNKIREVLAPKEKTISRSIFAGNETVPRAGDVVDEYPRHWNHQRDAGTSKSNSRRTPSEPEMSALPRSWAVCAEMTNSICWLFSSASLNRVRKTRRSPAGPAGWTVILQ